MNIEKITGKSPSNQAGSEKHRLSDGRWGPFWRGLPVVVAGGRSTLTPTPLPEGEGLPQTLLERPLSLSERARVRARLRVRGNPTPR